MDLCSLRDGAEVSVKGADPPSSRTSLWFGFDKPLIYLSGGVEAR